MSSGQELRGAPATVFMFQITAVDCLPSGAFGSERAKAYFWWKFRSSSLHERLHGRWRYLFETPDVEAEIGDQAGRLTQLGGIVVAVCQPLDVPEPDVEIGVSFLGRSRRAASTSLDPAPDADLFSRPRLPKKPAIVSEPCTSLRTISAMALF